MKGLALFILCFLHPPPTQSLAQFQADDRCSLNMGGIELGYKLGWGSLASPPAPRGAHSACAWPSAVAFPDEGWVCLALADQLSPPWLP